MAVEILRVTRRTDIDAMGNVVEVYHIEFRTERGVLSWVRVPVQGFDPEQARSVVMQEAAKLDALFEVGGSQS